MYKSSTLGVMFKIAKTTGYTSDYIREAMRIVANMPIEAYNAGAPLDGMRRCMLEDDGPVRWFVWKYIDATLNDSLTVGQLARACVYCADKLLQGAAHEDGPMSARELSSMLKMLAFPAVVFHTPTVNLEERFGKMPGRRCAERLHPMASRYWGNARYGEVIADIFTGVTYTRFGALYTDMLGRDKVTIFAEDAWREALCKLLPNHKGATTITRWEIAQKDAAERAEFLNDWMNGMFGKRSPSLEAANKAGATRVEGRIDPWEDEDWSNIGYALSDVFVPLLPAGEHSRPFRYGGWSDGLPYLPEPFDDVDALAWLLLVAVPLAIADCGTPPANSFGGRFDSTASELEGRLARVMAKPA